MRKEGKVEVETQMGPVAHIWHLSRPRERDRACTFGLLEGTQRDERRTRAREVLHC